MGFSFNLFGSSSHRQFNYKPRYYDVEAEERRKFFGDHTEVDELPEVVDAADKEVSADADNPQRPASKKAARKPGSYIAGNLRPGNYQKEVSHNTRTTAIIGIVSLILIFVVLIYIARFYAFLLG